MVSGYTLYRFTCGHVGRDNEGTGKRAKVKAFIRVSQIRRSPSEAVNKPCPDCKRG